MRELGEQIQSLAAALEEQQAELYDTWARTRDTVERALAVRDDLVRRRAEPQEPTGPGRRERGKGRDPGGATGTLG
jgi:hypothetical protein